VHLNKANFESFVMYGSRFLFLKVCLGRSDRGDVKMRFASRNVIKLCLQMFPPFSDPRHIRSRCVSLP
jgi:hypothetical protein